MDFGVPEFSAATDQLAEFMRSQGLSGDVVWITRRDAVWRNEQIFIRPSTPECNRDFYENLFDLGRKRDLGVRIEVLAAISGKAYCYVWIPKDSMDAEYAGLLMSKFIISLPTKLPVARIVSGSLHWILLRVFQQKPTWLSNLNRVPIRGEDNII